MSAKNPTVKEIQEYNSKEKTCKMCGKTFYKIWTKYSLTEFCSKECSKKYSSITNRDNTKVAKGLKEFYTPIVEENKRKYNASPKICPICGCVMPYERRHKKTCSTECSKVCVVKTARENGSYKNTGGYREGSGRSKSGYYKGFFCGSTYELVYYIYCKDHNIRVERNEQTYPYEWEGKTHTYLPDFITDDGLVEIKGYHTKQVDAKVSAVDKPIKVLYIKDLEPMMQYLDENYGVHHNGKQNNYHTLYDDYKPTFEYTCHHCGEIFTRDKKLKTDKVFCSRSCAGKFMRHRNFSE